MTRTIGKLFLAFLLWIPTYCAFAQPLLLFPDYKSEPGDTVAVKLRVANYEDIISTQFSIHWNKDVLKFVDVQDFNVLPDVTLDGNFGIPLAEGGILTFVWLDMQVTGITLPDTTDLFIVRYEVIGLSGDTSTIRFSDDPTLKEVADITLEGIPTNFVNGMVEVMSPNSIFNPSSGPFSIRDCYPNPFKESTQVQFHITQATQTRISIINTFGQLIWEDSRYLNAGDHTLPLKKELFPEAGTYFLRMQSNEFTASQKLILVQ